LCDEPALVQALRLSQGQRLIVCSVCPRSRQWEWAHISPGSDVLSFGAIPGCGLGRDKMPVARAPATCKKFGMETKLDRDGRRAVSRGWIVVVPRDKDKMLISIYDNDAEVIWNFYQWLIYL
jgi:hypothetical protein